MRTLSLTVALAASLAILGCQDPERELPRTELPKLPRSADLECERLTDEEIIACIRDPKSKEVCRKLETTCARYENLKGFVQRTWAARDNR